MGGSSIPVAKRAALWMEIESMFDPARQPAFISGVSLIVCGRSEKQMIWSYSPTIIASVANKKTVWNHLAIGNHPRHAMCQPGLAAVFSAAADPNAAILTRISSSSPIPTIIRFLNSKPKTVAQPRYVCHHVVSHRSAPTDWWLGARSGRATACRVLLLYHFHGRNEGPMSCAV